MFNILDIIIIGVILLSAVLAAWRGFTREVLSIGAWVGAAVVMFLFGPKAVPLAAQYVHSDKLALAAGYAAVFLIALIPLAYISYRIAEGVRDSFVGPVDRLLGFVFGGARGLLIVGVGYLVFTSLVSEARQPDWFKEARLKPLMAGTGNLIAKALPSRDGDATPKDDKDVDPEIGQPQPAAATPAPASKPVVNPPAAVPPPPAVAPAAPSKPKPPAKAEAKPPAPPATPSDKSAKAKPDGSVGYGEQQRDALDQLIGSATASPGGDKPSKADGHSAHR